MTKTEAINWCKTELHNWPNTTKFRSPEGWKWVVSQRPYQLPEFKLINADSEEIFIQDVF